jgi:hypothetical protein
LTFSIKLALLVRPQLCERFIPQIIVCFYIYNSKIGLNASDYTAGQMPSYWLQMDETLCPISRFFL